MNLISRESLTVKVVYGVTRSFQRQAGRRTSIHDARTFYRYETTASCSDRCDCGHSATRPMKKLQ